MTLKVKSNVLGGVFGAGALLALPLGTGLPAHAAPLEASRLLSAAPLGQPAPSYGSGGLARIGGLPDEAHVATTTLPNGRLLSISSNSGDQEVALRMLQPAGTTGNGFGPSGLRTFGTDAADEARDVTWSRHDDRGYAVATSDGATTVWAVTRKGGLDPAFGSGGVVTIPDASATRVAVDDWGRVVLAGSNAAGNATVWRLTPAGSPDAGFGTGGAAVGAADTSYDSVAVALDGSVFAGASGDLAALVTQLTPAGAPAAGFGDAGTATLAVEPGEEGTDAVTGVEVALQDVHRESGPRAVVSISHAVTVGDEGEETTTTTADVRRLTAAGAADAAFDAGGVATLHDPGRPLVLVDGHHVVIPGASEEGNPRLVQLTQTGAAQTGLGPNGAWNSDGALAGAASNVAAQPDGTYLVSGQPDAADAFVYAVGGTAVPRCGGSYATIVAHGQGDKLVGTRIGDVIAGGAGADTIRARAGNDTVCGGAGRDTIRGGAGDDRLMGNKGKDTLIGGAGNDILRGGKAGDLLKGGRGDDLLKGARGHDTLRGGKGNDTLRGGRGRDVLRGGSGDDFLYGGRGKDLLFGGSGNNVLVQ